MDYKENITKAIHSATFLVDELTDILNQASATEALVVMDMLADSVSLQTRIKQFMNAVNTELTPADYAERKAI